MWLALQAVAEGWLSTREVGTEIASSCNRFTVREWIILDNSILGRMKSRNARFAFFSCDREMNCLSILGLSFSIALFLRLRQCANAGSPDFRQPECA